jgi:acetylglutamate kinase
MDIVEMVLGGLVNKEIVSLINSHGGRAAGLSGKDGGLIRAKKLAITAKDNPEQIIDIGHVGEIVGVDPRLASVIQQHGFIPVIAPIGVGDDGLTYNINADTVAGKLAITLGADRLILMTNTSGVLNPDGVLLTQLKADSVNKLIDEGTIDGGMIPKMRCALDAVASGVNAAVVCDGRVPHAILLELLTNRGVGSIVTA